MATVLSTRKTVETAQIAVNSTGDKFTFTPGQPVDILRWGIIADALIDVGAGMTLALDKRITAGSDTGRVNGAVAAGIDTAGGTITRTSDVAAGAGLYHNVTPPFELDLGEQAVLEVTDAADTAGTGIIFIEYLEKPFVGGAPATAGSFSNRISNMTLVAS